MVPYSPLDLIFFAYGTQEFIRNYKCPPFFSAQLWIQDGDKLVNKAFSLWKFSDIEWVGIPTNPGDFGYLKDKSQTDTEMLLTPDKYWQSGTWHHFGGNEVILNKKTTTVNYKERQKWIRGTSDADGYFYLEHKVSGTYLTAQKDNVLTVNSKFEKITNYECILDAVGSSQIFFPTQNLERTC